MSCASPGPHQSTPNDVAGEVPLTDVERPVGPGVTDAVQRREHEIAKHRLDAERREALVENCVDGVLVVALDCVEQTRRHVRGEQGGRDVVPGDGDPSRLGGGEPVVECPAHSRHPICVLGAVQPEAAGGADRLQQPVAALPRAQHLGADADATGELPDAVAAGSTYRRHQNETIHTLYKHLTKAHADG